MAEQEPLDPDFQAEIRERQTAIRQDPALMRHLLRQADILPPLQTSTRVDDPWDPRDSLWTDIDTDDI